MNVKRIAILLFTIYFLFAPHINFTYAAQEDIPAPVGDIYVQDFANILSVPEKMQLISLGKAVEAKTGSQIAVLTVETTGEMEMAEYANSAYRKYGIGSKERNDGALLVIALKDRNIRIEVGYGLEGIIPDGKAGRIIDEQALTPLQAGKPNVAIMNTYKALANEVTSEITGDKTQPPNPTPTQKSEGTSIPSWLAVILIVGFLVVDFSFFGGTMTFFLLSILSRRGGGGGGGSIGGGGGSSGGGGAGRNW
jgi:uncharacterized protein